MSDKTAVGDNALKHSMTSEHRSELAVPVAVYEQMQRIGIIEPSLSKAHWLQPGPRTLTARYAPASVRRTTSPWAWKHHYPFAHYWAAYVAMTGEPFSFDPATLVKFICNASLGRFRGLPLPISNSGAM